MATNRERRQKDLFYQNVQFKQDILKSTIKRNLL